ncbi:predicted protein [Naegleria gruberi]|uniref:Predicted protein n=1 Tax=Naegleria gruberi TaxID=5762 RepID=D2VMR6_NAEGR|nr:uncharacterized protein NAEGRDRAFT_70233 [Naegleria gruberi]EFC41877.1 predicted protein [Naegleria gruberi]|eukprot:XP_002674621.1 predicted protein [Naegleria gruberi strain NEG-M]
MDKLISQFSIHNSQVYPNDKFPYLVFNPTRFHKNQCADQQNGQVGLGYVSTIAHSLPSNSILSHEGCFPFLPCLVKSELFCVNAKTGQVLVFNMENYTSSASTLEVVHSFNLKEQILSQNPSETMFGNNLDETRVFVRQIEYSSVDNSLVVLLNDFSDQSTKPATIVKLDLKGQVSWIGHDENCVNGICIKEESGIICGVNLDGTISECYHPNGSEINDAKNFISLESKQFLKFHNFQLAHYRERFLFPSLNGGMNLGSSNECTHIKMIDESGAKLENGTHAILHAFSLREDGELVSTFALDRKRGLVFSLVSPGPLSSICISHLGSGSQLFSMGPLFVSSANCKMVVNEIEQVLYIVSVSIERNSLEIHTFEYGRFNATLLEETKRINAEMFKSLKYLTSNDQAFLKEKSEALSYNLSTLVNSRLESLENARVYKNVTKIKEEIFEYGRLVTISPSDLKSSYEQEKFKAATQEKDKQMAQVVQRAKKDGVVF